MKPGETIGQYEIESILGRGGMGTVYAVKHLVLGGRHALKILHPEVSETPEGRERFRREARVMHDLGKSHPHILEVEEYGEEPDGTLWLKMPLMPGMAGKKGKRWVTLQDRMDAEGRLPEQEGQKLLEQILDGLGYAHQQGALHRDLKPANILLDEDGSARISDFGLVKVVEGKWLQSQFEKSIALTAGFGKTIHSGAGDPGASTEALVGTWSYMAPEVKKGEEATAASDLWAVGLLAFQLLTGREMPGFEPPSRVAPGLDPKWDAVTCNATAENPSHRYESAAAFVDAIRGGKTKKAASGRWLFRIGVPLVLIGGMAAAAVSFFGDPRGGNQEPAGENPAEVKAAAEAEKESPNLMAPEQDPYQPLRDFLEANDKFEESLTVDFVQIVDQTPKEPPPDFEALSRRLREAASVEGLFGELPLTMHHWKALEIALEWNPSLRTELESEIRETILEKISEDFGGVWTQFSMGLGACYSLLGEEWKEAHAVEFAEAALRDPERLNASRVAAAFRTFGQIELVMRTLHSVSDEALSGATVKDGESVLTGGATFMNLFTPHWFGGEMLADAELASQLISDKTLSNPQNLLPLFALLDQIEIPARWASVIIPNFSELPLEEWAKSETDPANFQFVIDRLPWWGDSGDLMVQKVEKFRPQLSGKPVSPADATVNRPYVNSLGMNFVPVPIGAGPSRERQVLFSIWETRVQDYAIYARESSSIDTQWVGVEHEGHVQDQRHPAVYVSWNDAEEFCAWLTQSERATGLIRPADAYRLPTDAEWTEAIRGKDGALPVYPWGNSWPPPEKAGNYHGLEGAGTWARIEGYRDDHPFTAPVGIYPPSQTGLYDLGGNVWEWCQDTCKGESNSRVLRGGSWFVGAKEYLGSVYQDCSPVSYRDRNVGFRCVLETAVAGVIAPMPPPSAIRPKEIVREFPDGAWEIVEQVVSENGGYRIVWDYHLFSGGPSAVTGFGTKREVDGKPANSTERRALSVVNLELEGTGQLQGRALESNGHGTHFTNDLDGRLAEDGRSFTVTAVDAKTRAVSATLTGHRLSMAAEDGTGSATGKMNWVVRELVVPEKGAWDIEWRYGLSRTGARLEGEGRKVRINGEDPTQGEKEAQSMMWLERSGESEGQLSGRAIERNYRGEILEETLRGSLSGDGRFFVLESRDGTEKVSVRVGWREKE